MADLATMVWAPHGHTEGIDSLRRLAQIVLLDTQDQMDLAAGLERAGELARDTYVVDLAWLRSTPWRERVAAAFDPPALRRALGAISAVTVRHRADSVASAVLFCGWLASRLGLAPGGARPGPRAARGPRAHAAPGDPADARCRRPEPARASQG